MNFEAPEYAKLYATLQSLGFRVIGVEFITNHGFSAPNWRFASSDGQFRLACERREWSNVRHTAWRENKTNVVDITKRCTALLELLGIRVFQMSNAYNGAHLAATNDGELPDGALFNNTYTCHIEAAIHAFLADAASLRDLICEFTWSHVLQNEGEVRKIAKFIARFRGDVSDTLNPLANEIIDESRGQGWIKHLSDLRNDVIHVAPIGTRHTFPSCQARKVQLPQGGEVSYLTYGLVDRTLGEASAGATPAATYEKQIVEELSDFTAKLSESEDALEYAWGVLSKLIDLCSRARMESGLKGEMLHLTDGDIVDFQVK